ncbi:MAG TPA: hypothetical protein VHH73_14370 [Verrucomicrobiae bacterium]|nr:hypothetical protein [Verrucomicrobiae bacterium]
MRKRTLFIAGLFALGMVVIICVAFRHPAEKPRASVTYLACTNDAAGTRFATFAVSNLSSSHLLRQADYKVELQTPKGDPNQMGRWFSRGRVLDAKGRETVVVSAPTNGLSWRIALYLKPNAGFFTRTIQTISFILSRNPYDARFDPGSYEVRSEWIKD